MTWLSAESDPLIFFASSSVTPLAPAHSRTRRPQSPFTERPECASGRARL